jgi:hypothetical protein
MSPGGIVSAVVPFTTFESAERLPLLSVARMAT